MTDFPLTPGAYLKHRRFAAFLSIADVADRLETEPRLAQHARAEWIAQIEADAMPATFNTIAALRTVFSFDLAILERLTLIAHGAELPLPRLCRICSCSDLDACARTPFAPCWWVAEDLCSACADPAAVTAAAHEASESAIRLRGRYRQVLDFSLPQQPDALS